MANSNTGVKFHSRFVRRFWFSFIWRFMATLIALGIVLGGTSMALKSLGTPPRFIWWIDLIVQFIAFLLASYLSLGETLNKYIEEFAGNK